MAFIPSYILVLLALIIIDYVAGLLIEPAKGKKRLIFLWVSLSANLAILCVFKYFNFFMDNMNFISQWVGFGRPMPYLEFILPIGLSFHTFQAMAYTIEVYRGAQKAERNLLVYGLYVMYFPQLVAGPIERPQNLLDQLKKYPEFDYQRAVDGGRQMLWGLFKKMVIADNLSLIVDKVYNISATNPNMAYLSGPAVWLATYAFAIQIYCDFSGYSDVAIGAARALGVNLSLNFNNPYRAQSIREFWRRWHISLSFWFRDYLYIPLQKSTEHLPVFIQKLNVVWVFLLSGLWHGANWTYVVWGGLHSLFSIFSAPWKKVEDKIFGSLGLGPKVQSGIRMVLTFHLVCLAWIFFRAASVHDAQFLISRLNVGFSDLLRNGNFALYEAIGSGRWKAIFLSLIVLYFVEFRKDRGSSRWNEWLGHQSAPFRWATYYAVVAALCLLKVDDAVQFIYFQF